MSEVPLYAHGVGAHLRAILRVPLPPSLTTARLLPAHLLNRRCDLRRGVGCRV